jgi:Family of unknown function (DUF5706)
MTGTTFNAAEAYEKILTGNLQRAVEFLKFAEAKNGALLILSSAWVFAIINLECSDKSIPSCLKTSLLVALVLSLCAALLAMISFLPRLHLPAFLGGKRAGPHPKNLLYYGDICTVPIKTLEQDLRARYWPDEGYKPDYIHDLVVQISVNSEITLRKMLLFRWGMGLIVVAGIVLLVPIAGMAYHSLMGL